MISLEPSFDRCGGLSTGAIVAIVISALVVVLLIVGGVCVVRRRRKQEEEDEQGDELYEQAKNRHFGTNVSQNSMIVG